MLQVQAEVPTALASQLRGQAAPIPGPVEGFALIDTGGGLSALHESAVQRLQLQPTEVIQVATAAGQHQRGVYSGRLVSPGTNLPAMDFSRMVSLDLTGYNLADDPAKPIIALVGRDILEHFVFIYNGQAGLVTLTF